MPAVAWTQLGVLEPDAVMILKPSLFRAFLLTLSLAMAVGAAHARAERSERSSGKSTATKSGKPSERVSTARPSERLGRAASPKPTRLAALRAGGGLERVVRLKRRLVVQRAVEPSRPSIGQAIGLHTVDDPLDLRSSVAMVVDQRSSEVLFQKNPNAVLPIASITKLMTAMVVLDSGAPMGETIEVTEADVDTERFSRSRLRTGSRLTRAELMQLALMASENRAASALGRSHPGGLQAFVAQMNQKARALGMSGSRFVEPTGLSSGNVSNATDLVGMVRAATEYSTIRQYSTASELVVDTGLRQVAFRNTNRLIDSGSWDIGVSKTGYISEAGNCLVMQTRIEGRPVIMVLLDAVGRMSRFADAQRIRQWLETPTIKASVAGRAARARLARVGS